MQYIIKYEEFEDTKGIIRIRIPKRNRQHNDRKKKYKKTKRSTKHTYKTKGRVTRTPIKPGNDFICSSRVSSSCSTSDTRRVNLFTNPVIFMDEERTGKCLRQVEHIRGHLWHRYTITNNHRKPVDFYSTEKGNQIYLLIVPGRPATNI